ncbi:MAG: Flp pilus assembly complex ATPase component TadA [candidate division NC10 bacterium]|nr:Flp pilus assembly complex ATPase component TadA [candidate division NC10 bacterium]MDE2321420.1 Flp pilus assembly complex ATPase component TadA [candidate division NC10 bacterium]
MRKQLGQILVDAKVIELEQLEQILKLQAQIRLPLGQLLMSQGLATEEQIATALAAQLTIPYVRLASAIVEPKALDVVPRAMAEKYTICPLSLEEKALLLVMADPLNLEAIKDVEFRASLRIRLAISTPTEIKDAIARCYAFEESLGPMVRNIENGAEVKLLPSTELSETDGVLDLKKSETTPAVKMVNLLISEAIKARASDIHIEPGVSEVTVRNRVDGILRDTLIMPKWIHAGVISRLKILGGLDIAERRLPQDGRIKVRYGERTLDLRVSTLPTHCGEKAVLRLLDPVRDLLSLEHVGLEPMQRQLLEAVLVQPQGAVLVTGPTGSGKTSTLYAALSRLKSPGINIVSIEDPIEFQIKGINQVQVNERAGLSFASTLRSVLRQDPDVIMVGEIRDHETAEIAFQASLTGHLVFSTLHTNDTIAAITRLLDLGIEPFLVASSVSLIIAQRLMRRLCRHCREAYQPSDDIVRRLRLTDAPAAVFRGKGCPACQGSGFLGRVGVYEFLPIDAAMRELIAQRASEATLRREANARGFVSLIEAAVVKIRAGLTSPDEVLRAILGDEGVQNRCGNCGEKIEATFTSCPACRAVLKPRCPSCRQDLLPEWKACPFCSTPVVSPIERTETALEVAPPPPGSKPVVSPIERQMKILVVDDEEDVRRIVAIALRQLPFPAEILTAGNGMEALEVVEAEQPSLVILDLMMPKMDGFEVCRRLREHVKTAFIPILMLTARGESETRTKAFLIGTDDYLMKPFEINELNARVGRLVRRTYGV